MMEPEEIISDEEIERVHANANFGSRPKRDIVNSSVLQFACGFRTGHTAWQICCEHGLVTKKYNVTKKGRQYLWACFGKSSL